MKLNKVWKYLARGCEIFFTIKLDVRSFFYALKIIKSKKFCKNVHFIIKKAIIIN